AAEHTGPCQQLQRVDRCGIVQLTADAASGLDELVEQRLVETQVRVGVGDGVEAQGAFHFAAGQLLAQALTQRAFQITEGVGQAQGCTEVGVVDRPELPRQVALIGAEVTAGKGRHAEYHGSTPDCFAVCRSGIVLRQSGWGTARCCTLGQAPYNRRTYMQYKELDR